MTRCDSPPAACLRGLSSSYPSSATSVIVLLLAVAVLAGHVASGSATLALPFLSHQPCILVLAAIPAGLGVLATNYRSRLRLRPAPSATPRPKRLDRGSGAAD
jgi:hypothetical protein